MIKKYLLIIFWVASCSPKNENHKPVETNAAPAENGVQGVDFARVKPIFLQYCTPCHPSRAAPNWLEYGQTLKYVNNGKLHQRVVVEKSMPQLGSAESAAITEADRMLISQWIEGGAVEIASAASPVTSIPLEIESIQAPAAAQTCLGCHGNLNAQSTLSSDIPKISGQNTKYLWHQLMNFKWYDRIDPTFQMNQQASSLTDREIVDIAEYFSKIGGALIPPTPTPLSGNELVLYTTGQKLASACIYCHKNQQRDFGTSAGLIPILNGQSRNYLKSQLLFYQNGLRDNSLMESIIENYTNEDIEALALYFSLTQDSKK